MRTVLTVLAVSFVSSTALAAPTGAKKAGPAVVKLGCVEKTWQLNGGVKIKQIKYTDQDEPRMARLVTAYRAASNTTTRSTREIYPGTKQVYSYHSTSRFDDKGQEVYYKDRTYTTDGTPTGEITKKTTRWQLPNGVHIEAKSWKESGQPLDWHRTTTSADGLVTHGTGSRPADNTIVNRRTPAPDAPPRTFVSASSAS